ncbi:hypothetical protein B0E46_15730 [Rhodanobacter sp. B04]|uniref:ATP-binding protein n=1 Tax=Rhodanobacter sp. B04 TaxID=1945860 RepID=UPI0009C47982|nr:ATP-binding protein [Rhodanobacter sp. B04]OOG61427.1 hypothetical protein B0E46_15730 [Rhodanobacter sp. B04]
MAPAVELCTCACERHGPYQAYRFPNGEPASPGVNDCPKCVDEMTERYGAENRRRAAAALEKKKLQKILDIASIPPRFADRTIGNYKATTTEQRVARSVCQGFAESWEAQSVRGGSLVLTGGPGTGKTHLACAIANQIMVNHLATVAFGTVASILRTVKATYGGKGDENKALHDLRRPDLLIIDEIGVQNGSDHELTLLFEIINERYQHLRSMILISNLDAAELEKFLGQRVADRFREVGPVLSFNWTSYRGQQQQALV